MRFARPVLGLFVLALAGQNLWVHGDGLTWVAALHPYGWAGTALITVLYLLDPVTVFYAYLMGRMLRRGVPGWPVDPGYWCASIGPGDIRGPLLRAVAPFVLVENGLGLLVQLILPLFDPRFDYGQSSFSPSQQVARLLLLAGSVWPAALTVVVGGLWGRGLWTRFGATILLQLPLLLIFFWAEVGTYEDLIMRQRNSVLFHYGIGLGGLFALGLFYVTLCDWLVRLRGRLAAGG